MHTFEINGKAGYTMRQAALALGMTYKAVSNRFYRQGFDLRIENCGNVVTVKKLDVIIIH